MTEAGKGDKEAIGRLLQRHLGPLRLYIRLRMGPRIRRWEEESDIAQSICLEVLQQLDGFDYQGEAAFRQWLFTRARRKLAKRDEFLRAEKRDVDQLISHAQGSSNSADPMELEMGRVFGSPSAMVMARETAERIEQALDAMPFETREIILMSRLAGMSTSEIARRLDAVPSTIRSTLCRGLAALGRALV